MYKCTELWTKFTCSFVWFRNLPPHVYGNTWILFGSGMEWVFGSKSVEVRVGRIKCRSEEVRN